MWFTAKNKKPREGSALEAKNNLVKFSNTKASRNFYCKSKNAGSKAPSNNGYYAKTNSVTDAWIEKHCDRPENKGREDPRPANIVAPANNSPASNPGTPTHRRPHAGTTRKSLEANVKRAQNAVNAANKNEYRIKYSAENRARQTRTLKAAKNALREFRDIHGV